MKYFLTKGFSRRHVVNDVNLRVFLLHDYKSRENPQLNNLIHKISPYLVEIK